MKRGNPPEGPHGGKRGTGAWIAGGKDDGDIELRAHLNETSADSGAGAAGADDGITTLAYHIDTEWMKEAYRRTRKNGAPGVDGQSATGYAANLEGNLESLVGRAKSGAYRAPPVRRVHIPKGDGSQTRPIGIPTFEDKVLQRGVAMALEAVYEQDFLDCSFGFRPKRSAHDALRRIFEQTMAMGGGWVLEVDVRKFFDTMDHGHLRDLLRRRVRDGVLLQ
jgi:retron-type reverse transcriptase